MKKKKFIGEYINGILEVALNIDSTERTFYGRLEAFLRNYFPHPTYSVQVEITAGRKIPDLIIYKETIPIIKFEAKDFRKVNLLEWIQNPSLNEETKHLREQCFDYRKNRFIVLISDFLQFCVIDPNSPVVNPRTSGYKPVSISRKYKIIKWDGINIPSLSGIDLLDETMYSLKEYLALYTDITIDTAEDLQRILLQFIKSDPTGTILNLRDEIARILEKPKGIEEKNFHTYLINLSSDFNNSLFEGTISDDRIQFVDLFTQLQVFSIFIGWVKFNETKTNHQRYEGFQIADLPDHLPSNTLIQRLIQISDFPVKIIDYLLKPIERCFQRANYEKIMNDMQHVYGVFYSDFLKLYNPKIAKELGVINTPDPVIEFIIKGIDHFLSDNDTFNITDGILDKNVFFLDPAAGTMGFSAMLMKIARRKLEEKILSNPHYNGESKARIKNKVNEDFNKWVFEKIEPPEYIKNKKDYLKSQPLFLENCLAFEILMAPYVLGYIRMLIEAEHLGAIINFKYHRPQLYLNNSLMNPPSTMDIDTSGKITTLESSLVKNVNNEFIKYEVEKSLRIRHDCNVMVVMGNPPYNVSSQNNTPWIIEKIQEYLKPELLKRETEKPQIKKLTGLRSMGADEIKFHRFAQWKITENSKQGIVAYITNNFYLDGDVARGMRKILREVYDEIWILNLNGDWKRGIPKFILDQGILKDKNVFDIGTGVCIGFFIRYNEEKHSEHKKTNKYNCIIKYHEIWGTREEKFKFLTENSITSISFKDIGERMDHEFTISRDTKVFQDLYNSFPGMYEIFKKKLVGFVTGQDTLVINSDKKRLKQIITNFYSGVYSEGLEDFFYINTQKARETGKKYKNDEINFNDNRDWKINQAIETGNINDAINSIQKCIYRGFDQRYICYYKPLLKQGTHQYKIMQYLYPEQENICICVDRGIQHIGDSNIAIVSDKLVEHKGSSSSTGLGTSVFPLNVNLSEDPNIFGEIKLANSSNVHPDFKELLPYEVNNDEIFYYIYGVLYVPQYRDNFKDFLKKDYPRIPFPNNRDILLKMAKLGKELVDLHLLKSENIRFTDCPYNETANAESRKLENFCYDSNTERIYFKKPGKTQKENIFWIGGITEEIWNFKIGGMQQIKQWLSKRKYISLETPKKNRIYHEVRHNEDELNYLRKMVSAIKKTLRLQFPEVSAEGSELNDCFKRIMLNLHEFDIKDLNKIVDELNRPKHKDQKALTDF